MSETTRAYLSAIKMRLTRRKLIAARLRAAELKVTEANLRVAEVKKINSILLANQNVEFVQRILHRDDYPVIHNEDGSYSTHRMAYSEGEDFPGGPTTYYDYPTIQMQKDGKLVEFSNSEEAFKAAMKSGDYITFQRREEAEWFSEHYKKVWGGEFE